MCGCQAVVCASLAPRSVVYEEGDDADDYSSALSRPLEALGGGGIRDNPMVTVNDFSQDLSVTLSIRHRPTAEFEAAKAAVHAEVVGFSGVPAARPAASTSASASASTSASASASTSIVSVGESAAGTAGSKKRPRAEDAATAEDDDGICVVEDGAPSKRTNVATIE